MRAAQATDSLRRRCGRCCRQAIRHRHRHLGTNHEQTIQWIQDVASADRNLPAIGHGIRKRKERPVGSFTFNYAVQVGLTMFRTAWAFVVSNGMDAPTR